MGRVAVLSEVAQQVRKQQPRERRDCVQGIAASIVGPGGRVVGS